jgi:hypothetical protein
VLWKALWSKSHILQVRHASRDHPRLGSASSASNLRGLAHHLRRLSSPTFISPMIMTALLDLPPELILNIIVQFDTFWRASPDNFDVQDDRTKTLLNLCRTCHYLRNIAQPPLHQIVGVSRHTEAGAFRTLSQLTETVTRRPDLARKTKTLLLKLGGLRKTDGASFLPWKDFASSDRQPVAEDALFYLVPYLKNVTSLELQTDDRKDDLWKAIWSIGGREEQSFPKLQDLSVRPYFGKRQPCECTPYNYNGACIDKLSVVSQPCRLHFACHKIHTEDVLTQVWCFVAGSRVGTS